MNKQNTTYKAFKWINKLSIADAEELLSVLRSPDISPLKQIINGHIKILKAKEKAKEKGKTVN